MKKITLLLLLFSASVAVAQPNDGCDLHRTRLIPYTTAKAAAERSLRPQRFMQPVELAVAGESYNGEFTFPFSWLERQVFLRVEGAGRPYEVFVNGKRAGGSNNGHAAAEYNITKIAKEDKNRVELRLADGSEVESIECFEKYSVPAIYIISQPRVRVRDIFYRTTIGMSGVVNADFGVVMHNQTLGAKRSKLYYELYLNDTIRLSGGSRDVALGMYGVDTMRFGAPVPDSVLWSSSKPQRLSLRLTNRIEGRDAEVYDLPLALRQLEYREGCFVINNEPIQLQWRELSPLTTVADLESLLGEGCRAVRFTAGMISEEVLEFCDANGIYVAVTAPINSSMAGSSRKRGGNPSNNPKWRDEYVERVEQMILSTKRHSSVVAYFLADNSANGIALYEAYIAAKRLAGDRPVFYKDGGGEWNSDRM